MFFNYTSSFLALLRSLYYIAHESLSVYNKTQVRQTTENTGENKWQKKCY